MKIIACGDIALCRSVGEKILEGKGDEIARGLREKLCKADIFLANVECPLTDSEKPAWDYFPTLKGPRSGGKFLSELGVNVASLANNHIADYGLTGFEDTISSLEEHGIKWCGAGKTPEEATKPLIIERNNIRIGILALAQPEISAAKNGRWGAGVLSDSVAIAKMKKLSMEVDIAIAYLHFGVEFSEYPTPHDVRLCRSLVDSGAKLVIGHHPHVPQGYENYKDGFIAYSLGNFIFDMTDGPHKFSRLGLMVQADFQNKKLAGVKIVPVYTRGGVTRLLTLDERVGAEPYLKQLCNVLVDNDKLKEAYYFTCRNNFELYANALMGNTFGKGNWRQARDLIVQQFWPQIFELRIDLIRFLLSGKALEFECLREKAKRDMKGHLWKWLCKISYYFGLPFRFIPGFRII